MSGRDELREFLTTRRARITPQQAGLPGYGGKRRVAGLRREEVALLAGVSVEYYARLERGTATGVSDGVLGGIARALQLGETEREHLTDLIRAAGTGRPARRRTVHERVRPSVQRLLDLLATPAFVRNGRLDVLATNHLGAALYAQALDDPRHQANLARFVFLDPRALAFYLDWDGIAHAAVGSLRAEAGRDPYDRRLTDLIGELSTRSPEFRVRWAAHDVIDYRSGTQPFHHPLVGDLTLAYEALQLPGDPGQVIISYLAEPGTPAQAALDLLAGRTIAAEQPPGEDELRRARLARPHRS